MKPFDLSPWPALLPTPGCMCGKLQQDLANEHSQLAQDAALRASMNERLERWVQALAPEVSQFIAKHIQDTVQRWDAKELSELVEQHIGKDLQFIRITGTVVGGAVGLLLFAIGHAGEIRHWLAA